jgi:NADH-quinone oxidoreductase subunit F
MERDPHMLIEGCIITCKAVNAHSCYIYVRGEFGLATRRLEAAVEEAYKAGILGKSVLGSGVARLHLRRGDRPPGQPRGPARPAPQQAAVPRGAAGLYARPTSVNNVESIASVPGIILEGVDWFTGHGHREVHRLRDLSACPGT